MGNGQYGRHGDPVATCIPGSCPVRRHHVHPDKVGTDAAVLAGLDDTTGILATAEADHVIADCDAVAYMASGDIRPDDAAADIERCLRAGVHVVTPRCTRSTTPPQHRRNCATG